MSLKDTTEKITREFKLTTLALKNKTTVLLLMFIIIFFGLYSYNHLPKELFPEINMPWIMVMTPYPGNPPVDIENLVTRQIEKELESVNGIKNITSNSTQDASLIFIEFGFDVDSKTALQNVKDAVDKAKDDIPTDLPTEPQVLDIDMSEFPVITINLSGDYSIDELKGFAEILEDKIESLPEVSKVEIQGVNEKEVKVDVDVHKMQSNMISFTDIEDAIRYENMSISGGEITVGGARRAIRTVGEFESIEEIKDIIVKHEDGNLVYLRDIADVYEGYEDPTSYARLNKNPVVSLQVVKKGGQNLLNAIDKINAIQAEITKSKILPENLEITTTGDQSIMVRKQLDNLVNSMFISIIFVVMVLYFFLGTRNALFVGLAIPLSMLMSIMVMSLIGWRINMIVLFALILALGMLVDNAIVVVENIYRFIDEGYSKFEAAKRAVGEIAVPIIASTATTLAAFVPLVFWNSIMGEFMRYLPITLIIVLISSLLVALVIIPVISSIFIKKDAHKEKPVMKRSMLFAAAFVVLSVLFFIATSGGWGNVLGNLFALAAFITLMNYFVFNRIGAWFQNVFLVKLENIYLHVLTYTLKGARPLIIMIGSVVLMFLTMGFYFGSNPKVEFFPEGDPKMINIMAELPIGTDIQVTNEFMKVFEQRVFDISQQDTSIIESIVTNVGAGAKNEDDVSGAMERNPHKGLVTVTYVDYELRGGRSTSDIMKELADSLIDYYPGIAVKIAQNNMGPPMGKPINIEVKGDNYDSLISLTQRMITKIEAEKIDGIEGLKIDVGLGKLETIITVNRENARRFGLSTGQIGSTIRTALFGNDNISDFKVGDDEYPIVLRLKEEYRNELPQLMNQLVTFRNMKGRMVQIPISAVATMQNNTTYDAVKRKNLSKAITIASNVIEGYNANEINQRIKAVLEDFHMPNNYDYKFTGEQQDQQESADFMARAMMIAIALIMIILVSQFNSAVKPLIILASILLSTIGVFGGLATFHMNFIVVMTGIGIISLAGVVVNNAIVLIDYIDLLKARKREELHLEEGGFLPLDVATECIAQAGKTRLRPVLLTAITTILGLLPMALGININFTTLFTEFDPQFSIGGDMTAMWESLSWTVIFGLSFATFLTLVIVPVMYRLATRFKYHVLRIAGKLPENVMD